MNYSMKRITELDAQIDKLLKILDNGSYLAAGISLDLTIGEVQEDGDADIYNMTLGLYSDCEGILNKILQGLQDSRKQWVLGLRKEVEDAAKFLEGR